MFCGQCGTRHEGQWTFCPVCGGTLAAAAPLEAAMTMSVHEVIRPEGTETVVTFCMQCGTRMGEEVRFCPSCGATVASPGSGALPAGGALSSPRPSAADLTVVMSEVTRRFVSSNKPRVWWRVLLFGVACYYGMIALFNSWQNPNMIPSVIFFGAFMVPVAFVIYIYESGALLDITLPVLSQTFIYGAVLAFAAVYFLYQFAPKEEGNPVLGAMLPGFIEELAKVAGVIWLIRNKEFGSEMHGVILGAAAGMGFSAFETMGYGFKFFMAGFFSALQQQGGTEPQAWATGFATMTDVLNTRALLSAFGHGTWTAIVVAAIWREKLRFGKFVVNRNVVTAYLIAAGLHSVWDYYPYMGDIPIVGGVLGWEVPYLKLPVALLLLGAAGLLILRFFVKEASLARSGGAVSEDLWAAIKVYGANLDDEYRAYAASLKKPAGPPPPAS